MPQRSPHLTKLVRLLTGWALLAALAVTPALAQDLTIRFFNVGQGDAALITSPEGKTALIDGGPNNGLAAYDLDSLHVDTLDLMVASHNHADHLGGLWDIMRTITVLNYLENGNPGTTDAYYEGLAMLHARHVRVLADSARTIHLGSVALGILPGPPGDKSQNNSSVGVLVVYGAFTALFTGDAEGKERRYWESHSDLPHVSILKVAHHGAANGTDSLWLTTVEPQVAVISVGAHNTYKHPSPKTLGALAAIGATVYRTDREGDITVVVDSIGGFTIRTDSSTTARTWPAAPGSYH